MLKKVVNLHKKMMAVLLIFIVTFCLLDVMIGNSEVKADSNRYEYNGNNIDTNMYPGFKEKIDALKQAHPSWKFVIMETGLDWNQSIVAESSFAGKSPYSLISGKSGDWICSVCGKTNYGTGWYHASEDAIKYFMDTRNWINDNAYIFQFLQLAYMETTDADVYNALNGTFLYTMDNARTINNACREKGANPYYVIARVLQEQGNSSNSATYAMDGGDGNTYYNLFNIGASGNSTSEIVANALATAKSRGWTSVSASIKGGIDTLFSGYLSNKQDTMYLNKFDVESYKGIYSNQYMQNIEAPKAESLKMYNKIKDTDLINQKLTFVIPVYTNMPTEITKSPDEIGEIGPKNIKVKDGHSGINIRSARSNESKIVQVINDSNTIILSVERYGDGWHKVILTDGTVGYTYFNSTYFEEINDITNCSENMVLTGEQVYLRAGPGKTEPVITTLALGQAVTRIDSTGRYNIDGITWDRIILADGRQGFISREYLRNQESSETFTIKAEGGLFLRTDPNGYNIRLLPDGSTVTRIEIGSDELIRGFHWDKVSTPSGAVGYVAREYLRDSDGNVPSGKPQSTNTEGQNNSKKDDANKIVTMEPNTKLENLKEKFGENIIVKNSEGTVITDGNIGTGYKIQIENQIYTSVKLGDVNGDGEVDIIDMALMKRDLTNAHKLTKEYKSAAKISSKDDNSDIDIIDMALIKRYLIGSQSINLK